MAPTVDGFEDFRQAFFDLFTRASFLGSDYLSYLARPDSRRRGDEASLVDTAIVSPLLELLGFEPAEQVYNQRRETGKPDFAPEVALYGTCFLVEDKNTTLDLTLDLSDPDGHLRQLRDYVRAASLRLGLLTNGRLLMAWHFVDFDTPQQLLSLDIPNAIQEWNAGNPRGLSAGFERALRDLYDLFRRERFTDSELLEQEIAVSQDEWQRQAIRLGIGGSGEQQLVEALQILVRELQHDARRRLTWHLDGYNRYAARVQHVADDDTELAVQRINVEREKVLAALAQLQGTFGLEPGDREAIGLILSRMEHEAAAYGSLGDVTTAVLTVINTALGRAGSGKQRSAKPLTNGDMLGAFGQHLEQYTKLIFAWHGRQSALRKEHRTDVDVRDDYATWTSLVRETLLGGLDEHERRDEFALQAAYVVFIRLLLIRVCEDKGIFPQRFISDGGFAHWQQEDIPRYQVFANGNPYAPLLEMAYTNAQNIYAHFFTGRELFNWFRLDRRQLIMALHRLSRFDFANVDSDLVGTIYNTYVDRKEKRHRGQYYTPPAIINYILDTAGYVSGPGIIGPNKRLIDPACGSGSFLVSAGKRLVAAYHGTRETVEDPETVLRRVQDSLYGFDLNPFACYLAEVNLLIQVLDLVKLAHDAGKRPKLQRFHIYNTDALIRPPELSNYAGYNTALAEEGEYVDNIKRRAPGSPYAAGFAFVVANPPYGATLSESYKNMLRLDWAEVFHGKPDTYTFFFKLGIELLAKGGKLGYITPNTYLMGVNTLALRKILLHAGRIEQIVDLPQGIWPDANVDCALLFLTQGDDEQKRREHNVQVHLMALRDTLFRLTTRSWTETLTQSQGRWIADPRYEISFRYDDLLQRIEDACRVAVNGTSSTRVLRLGDVTESTQGIIPYKTRQEGMANLYIRPRRSMPPGDPSWKPLLDARSFVGRYGFRWGSEQPYLKYGDWLWCPREPRFFESTKLIVQDMRNRALKRRLVAAMDSAGFYNRHNFSNIIAKDSTYDLRYVLALFNSSLLNYWFARRIDNLHINPTYFRQLPIYPADPATQEAVTTRVDRLLRHHAELNTFRADGYSIRERDGATTIAVPYDVLLSTVQHADPSFPVLTFFDARAAGMFKIPDECDLHTPIGSNVSVPDRFPDTVVLRHQKLWLQVPDPAVRRYIHRYLGRPRWRGQRWDDLKMQALIPADGLALDTFFAHETQQVRHIQGLLDEVARLDAELDDRILDLYGIINPSERERVLSSAPRSAEEEQDGDLTGVSLE